MSEIKIPFLERFREPMLKDVKTMTTRTKRYGKQGDTFEAFGAVFEIWSVDKFCLGDIANLFWKREGVSSPEEFKQVWKRLHPGLGFPAYRAVWGHSFRRKTNPL